MNEATGPTCVCALAFQNVSSETVVIHMEDAEAGELDHWHAATPSRSRKQHQMGCCCPGDQSQDYRGYSCKDMKAQ